MAKEKMIAPCGLICDGCQKFTNLRDLDQTDEEFEKSIRNRLTVLQNL